MAERVRIAGEGRRLEGFGDAEVSGHRRPEGTVEVVAYDASWPSQFERERELLSQALPTALSIEHIGSTSVPGLSAKPTLDILVVLPAAKQALQSIADLAAIGYDYRPGSFPEDADHLFFRKVVSRKRTHHLHVLSSFSPKPAEYRLFREFLLGCPEAAARYEAEKLALAEKCRHDRAAYVLAKEQVVEELVRQARAWHREVPG